MYSLHLWILILSQLLQICDYYCKSYRYRLFPEHRLLVLFLLLL